jgi:hypothetical protein
MPFGASDEQILEAAKNFLVLLDKANDLVRHVPDGVLSGSDNTVYLKKLGHRPLKLEDTEAVIYALGTEQDKRYMAEFRQAQQDISIRLKNTRNIGLVVEQAQVPYDQVYKRASHTSRWKPEQMIAIMETLRRLQL